MARLLTAGGVDLAIVDLKLGNENGLEIIRALRAESDLPIIVLTGQHLDVDVSTASPEPELGFDDYLTKPFSPRELLARIRAVLRRVGTAGKCDSQNRTPSGRGTDLPVGCSACGTVV